MTSRFPLLASKYSFYVFVRKTAVGAREWIWATKISSMVLPQIERQQNKVYTRISV